MATKNSIPDDELEFRCDTSRGDLTVLVNRKDSRDKTVAEACRLVEILKQAIPFPHEIIEEPAILITSHLRVVSAFIVWMKIRPTAPMTRRAGAEILVKEAGFRRDPEWNTPGLV